MRHDSDMATLRKDIAATALTALAVLVYAITHEGWDVWLIGDHHRWAAAVIVLLGGGVSMIARSAIAEPALAVLSSVAVVLAAAALISGTLTPLSLLVVEIIGLWFASSVRRTWPVFHEPVAR